MGKFYYDRIIIVFITDYIIDFLLNNQHIVNNCIYLNLVKLFSTLLTFC